MPLFNYRAVDQTGNPVEGTLDAASARAVVAALQEQGLTVNSVEEAVPRPFLERRKDRLTWKDLDELNAQLLSITRSHLPLAQSIAALAQDLRSPRVKAVLEGIRLDLEAGNTLEDALNKHPESFSPVYRALVRAGERSGNLSGVFLCLSNYSTRMLELKNCFQEMLAYPALLLTGAVVLITLLLVKIVPAYESVFQDFGARLPWGARFFMGLSELIRAHPLMLTLVTVFVVAVLGKLALSLLRMDSGGYRMDWVKLHLPLAGKIYAGGSLSRFCRALGLLLQARVPMPESLELAGAAAGNDVLRQAVARAGQLVSGGMPLAVALRETKYFESGFCWLLGNGEQRGEADKSLLALADDYEQAIDRSRRWILSFVEPAIVVVIGIVYASFAVAMYLPIFSLGDAISGN